MPKHLIDMSNRVDTSEFTHRLDAVLAAYRKLPTEIATVAVNFSKDRFREQAWLDKTKEKWKPLKNARNRKGRRSQTILVDTGRLKRSIRKIKVTQDQIIIGSSEPYASIQNDGGEIKKTVQVKSHQVRSHRRRAYTRSRNGRAETVKAQTIKSFNVKSYSRKMNTKIPARQFMGKSDRLNRRIVTLITVRFKNALK